MTPRGLCTSPNGHLITMISCINLVCEPAKIQALSKVVLVPWLNDKAFFVDSVEKLLDERWLEKEKITSPMDVCDRLDYLRSVYPLLSFENFLELYNKLETIARCAERPENDAQFTKLKIVAFLLLKLLQQNNAKMIEEPQKIDLNFTIYKLIDLHNKEAILRIALKEIATRQQSSVNSLPDGNRHQTATVDLLKVFSVQQCKSLRNVCKSLKKNTATEEGFNNDEMKKSLESELDKFKDIEDKIDNEFCYICQAEIPFISENYAACSNGHQFDRCARSLLSLDLYSGVDSVCEHCKRHYMTHSLWPMRNKWLCEICQ